MNYTAKKYTFKTFFFILSIFAIIQMASCNMDLLQQSGYKGNLGQNFDFDNAYTGTQTKDIDTSVTFNINSQLFIESNSDNRRQSHPYQISFGLFQNDQSLNILHSVLQGESRAYEHTFTKDQQLQFRIDNNSIPSYLEGCNIAPQNISISDLRSDTLDLSIHCTEKAEEQVSTFSIQGTIRINSNNALTLRELDLKQANKPAKQNIQVPANTTQSYKLNGYEPNSMYELKLIHNQDLVCQTSHNLTGNIRSSDLIIDITCSDKQTFPVNVKVQMPDIYSHSDTLKIKLIHSNQSVFKNVTLNQHSSNIGFNHSNELVQEDDLFILQIHQTIPDTIHCRIMHSNASHSNTKLQLIMTDNLNPILIECTESKTYALTASLNIEDAKNDTSLHTIDLNIFNQRTENSFIRTARPNSQTLLTSLKRGDQLSINLANSLNDIEQNRHLRCESLNTSKTIRNNNVHINVICKQLFQVTVDVSFRNRASGFVSVELYDNISNTTKSTLLGSPTQAIKNFQFPELLEKSDQTTLSLSEVTNDIKCTFSLNNSSRNILAIDNFLNTSHTVYCEPLSK